MEKGLQALSGWGRVLGLVFAGAALWSWAGTASAQQATGFVFHDADAVAQALSQAKAKTGAAPGTTPDSVWIILKGYGVTAANVGTMPFLSQVKALIVTGDEKTKALQVSSGVGLTGAQSLNPSGLSSTGAIDAIATFIAQRFKQEAEIAAVDEIVKELKALDAKPQYHDVIRALFPRTLAFALATSQGAATSNPASWNSLNAAFKQDLANLGTNIVPFLQAFYPGTPVVTSEYYFMEVGLAAGTSIIRQAKNPSVIIDSIETASANLKGAGFPSGIIDFDRALAAVAFTSHMLMDKGPSNSSPWASADQLASYLGKPASGQLDTLDTARILLGLEAVKDPSLYTKLSDWVTGAGKPPLTQTLANNDALTSYVSGLVQLLTSIEQDSAALNQKPATTVADARALAGDVCNVMAVGFAALYKLTGATLPKNDFSNFTTVLTALLDITDAASKGNYTEIVSELIVVVPIVVPAENSSVKGSVEAFLVGPGQAIAAMAQAKNQADFSAALDNYALPPGSYTQKQHSPDSVTLNAYFGGTVGGEVLMGNLTGTTASRVGFHAGFTAPVGVAWNWGKTTADPEANPKFLHLFKIGSESIFVPVIDVGAIAAWRIGNGTGQLASVKWSNVVAPGIYYVWTMKDTPFSVMIGTQYGPQARSVSSSGGVTLQKAAWQIPVLSFTFDIPVFNFYQATQH